MHLTSSRGTAGDTHRRICFEVLCEDDERVVCRGWRTGADGNRNIVLAVLPAAERPSAQSLDRLVHEYELKDQLDSAWSLRPLQLVREDDQTMLVLENSSGELLDRMVGRPMEMRGFLRIAIGIAVALRNMHQRGLVHKDVKPANILVNRVTGEVRLTGFGIASRLPRERQLPEPPECIAGTLAYMAPEQTGRMNRSIDARSDLYSLGVTLYEMLTGRLPFTASDPMEWVHCHIARQPLHPAKRMKHVPAAVLAIVMKLLAKMPEERYQTAAGAENDLRRCLADWESKGSIEAFPLGERDIPDRLVIPERLYGRDREIRTLLAAFDRVVRRGTPELVLVSGYSGIGKSSVVNELHKMLVPPHGLFAAGKFDQYKRDIPYATLAQAFRSLIVTLLGKSEAELDGWRSALREALGPNGQLMVDLVPELQLIIGAQPPVPDVPPQDAQRRFQLVFRRFIGVFAKQEHPLALFLDDLQWLDAATLDLMEDLSTHEDVRHLLLIGAYRENEVDATHPLMRKLDSIRQAGTLVSEITLVPLARKDLRRLIADSLHCGARRVDQLTKLVHDKTDGNPFFAIQFLSEIAEEGLLSFEHATARWSWDLGRIRAKGFTGNVVDLMAGKLHRLPAATQAALQQLACLGNTAETATLSLVHGTTEKEIHAHLWEAVRQGFVVRRRDTYKFLHDRVQEAAYSLIPEHLRAEAHLRIGRLLAAHTPPDKRDEAIFEIVNQFNRGAALITTQDERDKVAGFNLIAGKRAKASTAYASALNYFIVGAALLGKDCWAQQHRLTFELELNRAECELLTGALTAAEERLWTLWQRCGSLSDSAAVASLRITLYTTMDRTDRGVDVGLEYLRRVGVQWSEHPTKDDVRQEYERLWQQLGRRPIEAVLDLSEMTDPDLRATLYVLMAMQPAAVYTDRNLHALVVGRMANISLEYGNAHASCMAYVWVGMVVATEFGNYDAGFRFGKMGLDLVEQRGLDHYKARVYMGFAGWPNLWGRPFCTSLDLVRRAASIAQATGDHIYLSFAGDCAVMIRLASGDPLDEVQREAESGLGFARKVKFGLVADIITGQRQLIRALRGLTQNLASFSDAGFDESAFERHLDSDHRLALAKCWYWNQKLQACFHAGDYAAALGALSQVEALLPMFTWFAELAAYHFYGALLRAALHDLAPADEQPQHRQALMGHCEPLKMWAENCRENFSDRAALVAAEIARIEGRDLEAMRLYEQALEAAHENGFAHTEALANELAGRFYINRGLEKMGYAHLREARDCYARWGADGKVGQLDRLYPRLAALATPAVAATPLRQLDVVSVVKASQALSSEIVLSSLTERLMTIALENAGADCGLLVLSAEQDFLIRAKAKAQGDKIEVTLCQEPITGAVCPETLLRYVIRTRERVILDDTSRPNLFSADEYLRDLSPRSILGLPLIKQGRLTGLLYLENTLASHVFTRERVAVLELLAAQAAISLENSRLCRDILEREAKIRRLVDTNIIGVFIANTDGWVIEANDAFFKMAGYSQDDLASGLHWTQLTPPEWQPAVERAFAQVSASGASDLFEKETIRKNGSRVPTLVGIAAIEGTRSEFVAFVLDLSERKRAEAAIRESERRHSEMQAQLAHANRVAVMGQLTASIAHEVSQPLGAVVTNAQAALRWLDTDPAEVRHALDRIVRDGYRAGDVVRRIRDLVKKAPPRDEGMDINQAIREVIALTHVEAVRSGIAVQAQLAESLPLIQGDRVQFQQVILNLTINAIEAMSGITEGPREIVISSSHEGPDVLVAVRDTGPGLRPETFERVFDPFYTTKPEGMGMGLSICRSIIEAHGGRLSVMANLPRGGATFLFTLPIGESIGD